MKEDRLETSLVDHLTNFISVSHLFKTYFVSITYSFLSLNQSCAAVSTCGFNHVVALGIALEAA